MGKEGVRVKAYRGMASQAVLESKHYGGSSQLSFGVSATVVDKGSTKSLLPYHLTGLAHGLQDLGYRTIPELHASLYDGALTLEVRSGSAIKEGNVHDLKRVNRGSM